MGERASGPMVRRMGVAGRGVRAERSRGVKAPMTRGELAVESRVTVSVAAPLPSP